MEAVNLLPVEYRVRKKKSRLQAADGVDSRRALRTGGIVTLVFAVLLGGLYFYEHSQVSSKQKALADSQARVAAIQPQVDKIKADQTAASERLVAAESVTSTRMNWDRALNDFARVIPTNSYLTGLAVTAPTPTVASAAGTTSASSLSISGNTGSVPGVALVMDRLSLLPWLNGVTLTGATRGADGTESFSITASVSEEH